MNKDTVTVIEEAWANEVTIHFQLIGSRECCTSLDTRSVRAQEIEAQLC